MKRQNRILALLGPAAVIYLIADAATHAFDTQQRIVALVAFALSLAPIWLRHRQAAGARRVGSLGIMLGMSLATLLSHARGVTVTALVFRAIALPIAGALLFDLALVVPDRPGRLLRLRPFALLLVVVSAVAGVVGAVPPDALLGDALIPEAMLRRAPVLVGVGLAVGALLLRLLRRSLGSGPAALASNAWAVMGLLGALGGPLVVAGLLSTGIFVSPSQVVLNTGLLAALSALYGHVALVDPARRLYAGAATRRALVVLGTAAIMVVLLLAVKGSLPDSPASLAWVMGAAVSLAFVIERLIAPVIHRAIAPFGGRLLDAIDEMERLLPRAGTLEDVGRAVLAPLRTAAGEPDAQPLLYLADPSVEVRIDAAGMPHVRSVAMPESVRAHADGGKGTPIVTTDLEEHVVRQPELRALVEDLLEVDAVCALPLVRDDSLEGVLFIPRGRRRSLLTLEEINALREFGDRLGAIVAWSGAALRAQSRVGKLATKRDRGEEENDALREELERLRADAVVLRAGQRVGEHDPNHVAYSPTARAMQRRLDEVAKLPGHIALIAEAGAPVAALAARVHRKGQRADGPFVMADCAALRADEARGALLGAVAESPLAEDAADDAQTPPRQAQPGWLRLASGGTLVLVDVVALPRETQRDLAEALSVRQVRPIGGSAVHPIDVRIVVSSRAPLSALVAAGALDPELGRWLSRLEVRVPALRDRQEDIPSLTFLAIDRACRRAGREPVGVDQSAMDLLLTYPFPGDVRELESVIERALPAVKGPQITARHLSAVLQGAAVDEVQDPFEGTWAEIEKRVLEQAMARAGGNKSEAARSLGLKRTTFLDKLRRHQVDAA